MHCMYVVSTHSNEYRRTFVTSSSSAAILSSILANSHLIDRFSILSPNDVNWVLLWKRSELYPSAARTYHPVYLEIISLLTGSGSFIELARISKDYKFDLHD